MRLRLQTCRINQRYLPINHRYLPIIIMHTCSHPLYVVLVHAETLAFSQIFPATSRTLCLPVFRVSHALSFSFDFFYLSVRLQEAAVA